MDRTGIEDGFTLIEVLVALAVFSIAATALLRLSGQNARTAAVIEARSLAAIAADNALADAILTPNQLEIGETEADVELGRRRFAIMRTVSETPNPLVIQLTIEARHVDADGEPQRARQTRTAFRRRP